VGHVKKKDNETENRGTNTGQKEWGRTRGFEREDQKNGSLLKLGGKEENQKNASKSARRFDV